MRVNRMKWVAAIVMLALMTGTAGCGARPGGAPEVLAVAVEDQSVQTQLNLAGVLAPSQTVNLASRFSGQVVQVNGDVGTAVKAGDVLIALDTENLKAQLAQAQAGLKSAEADLQVSHSKAGLTQVTLDAAQKSYDRIKALYDSGAASQSQMDSAADALSTARKQFENDNGPAVAKSQASIATAQANIRNYQVQIANGTVKAPIGGIITNRSVNPGEVVNTGTTLISIADTSRLKLRSTIGQEMLPYVKTGTVLDVMVDVFPDKVFKGTVTGVGPVAVSTGELFPIEVTVENDGSILAGLSAHVTLDVSGAKHPVIPASALGEKEGKAWVFVVQDGKVRQQAVTPGIRSGKGVEILNGLKAGETVAVTHVEQLKDGMAVQVK